MDHQLLLGRIAEYCVWRNWKVKNVVTVTTLVAVLFYLLFISGSRDEQLFARSLGFNEIKIIKWTPNGETEQGDSNRRIFFHETSGRGYLNLRQTCTVESTAKHNPGRPVQVFMTADRLDYSIPWLSVLQNYANVSVILVDPAEYFANTPLEAWYKEEEWATSLYRIVHLSDYIRVVTLQKGGGMYMDLDIVTMKPFDEQHLWNFFLIETEEMQLLSNAVLHLEHGHRLIEKMIERLVTYYEPDDYIWHGPILVSYVMSRNCGVKRGRPDSNNCTDARLVPHYSFGPVENTGWETLFKDATEERMAIVKNGSYGVHCWSGKSKNEPLYLHSNQVYAVLARENCPITVAMAEGFPS